MRRDRAERLLTATVAIAEEINADTGMMHYVSKLSVFGSYLSEDSLLSDLSIAYDLGARGAHNDRHIRLITQCLKLGKGMQLYPHSAIDDARKPHRVIYQPNVQAALR